jgi:hypothetical protein
VPREAGAQSMERTRQVLETALNRLTAEAEEAVLKYR